MEIKMKFNDNEMEQRLAAVMTEWGFIAGRSKKFWVEDHGCYLIAVEFRPCLGRAGIMPSIHVQFMWGGHELGTFAYAPNHARCMDGDIFVPDSPTGALILDDPHVEEHFSYVMERMQEEIAVLRRWDDLYCMSQDLTHRRDLFYIQNRDRCNEVDVDLGIAKMLSGDTETAVRIFRRAADRLAGIHLVWEQCETNERFRQYILAKTNEVRGQYAKRYRMKLSLLETLPF